MYTVQILNPWRCRILLDNRPYAKTASKISTYVEGYFTHVCVEGEGKAASHAGISQLLDYRNKTPTVTPMFSGLQKSDEDHLIPECVVFHGLTNVSVTAAFPLPVHTCGTIFSRAFDKPIRVTNVSNGS